MGIVYRYNFTLAEEIVAPAPKEAQVNLRGRVLQRGNRAPLNGASVAVDEGAFGAVTDEHGAFEIAGLPTGRHRVVVAAAGFDRFETEEEIAMGRALEVTYYAHKQVFTPYETVVRGKREKKDVASIELKQEEIRLVAGSSGDAFRVVQDLPGVARAPYSFGLLIVRGGRTGDTRVYVDGVWIPIMFHFLGLTSVYNSDLLANLTFLPGNFSAQDGRATGGVVDATSRTPSKEDFHGYANLSLIDSTVFAEGPVSTNWSAALSARISYVDLILKEVLPSTVQFATAPRYWDYQLKAEWAPKGGNDRVALQWFGSHDMLKLILTNAAMFDPEGRSDIAASSDFERWVASWRHGFTPELTNRLTLAFGIDNAQSSSGSDIKGDITVNAFQLRDTLDWAPSKTLSFSAGTDSYIGWYSVDVQSPPLPLPGEVPDPIVSRQLIHDVETAKILEPGLFVDASWKPFAGTRIIPGIRLDYEATLKYATVDPRLSVFQEVVSGTTLKGALGLYSQPPDFRFLQWTSKFGNPHLGPEHSAQAMVGIVQRLTDVLNVDVQLYYKSLWNLEWNTNDTRPDGTLLRYINSGQGRAYGVEVLLRHELTPHFFGWISYSYSRSFRRSTEWTTGYLPAQFDQPHHLVAVASYKWPFDIITGMRFQWASGNLTTPYTGAVYDSDADMYMPVPGTYWSHRLPDFVSLDLRIDKRFVFQQWTLNAFLDVQNVTNNKNAEFTLYNFNFSVSQLVMGMPIFPSLGLKAEF